MSSYESKALLLAVLRYSQAVSDQQQTEKFIEELLVADNYVPKPSKQEEPKKRIPTKKRPDPIRGA